MKNAESLEAVHTHTHTHNTIINNSTSVFVPKNKEKNSKVTCIEMALSQ